MKRPKIAEATLVLLLFVFGTGMLTVYYKSATIIRHLDSVFLFESVDSILASGTPASATVVSWQAVFKQLGYSASEICSTSFVWPESSGYNVLKNHAYFGLYLVAALASMAGSETAIAILNSIAHISIPLICWAFLRRQNISGVAAAMFVICVLVYPVWSLSAAGDYYLDRLYIPCMLLLLFLLHNEANGGVRFVSVQLRACGLLAVTAITASMTERGAGMTIAALVFFTIFFPSLRRKKNNLRWLPPILASAVTLYLIWYFRFVFVGLIDGGGQGGGLISLGQINARLQSPQIRPFLQTNLLYLGWIALFAGWRYVLLFAGAILPNLFFTIGGAELNGWTTHYHAMYAPFAVFTAACGFTRICSIGSGHFVFRAAVPAVAAAFAIVCAGYHNPYTAKWGNRFIADGEFGITHRAWLYFYRPELSADRASIQWLSQIGPVIPAGSRVSTIEGAMPAIYRSRHLGIFPYGMDQADFLVVSLVPRIPGQLVAFKGFSGSLGPPESDRIEACLAKRAENQGFRIHHELPAVGVLVLKRQEASRVDSHAEAGRKRSKSVP